jgi:hypothetical protein
MRILIRYSDSTVQAAILLAMIGSRVRAAVPGCDDAVEFTRTSERWSAEDGRAVEIEFDATANAAEWSAVCNAAASTDSAAGFEPTAAHYWQTPEPPETVSAYLN